MQTLQQFDLDLFRAIHVGLHRDWLDPVFWLLTSSGLGWVQVTTILLIPIIRLRWVVRTASEPTGFRLIWHRWGQRSSLVWPLAAAVVVSGALIADIIKLFVERERPSHLWFAHPQENIGAHSFPSGHTSTAFGIAFLLLFVFSGTSNSRYGWLAVLWASLVGLSRIYRGVHWPTDVLGGICSGLIAACLIQLLLLRPLVAAAKNRGYEPLESQGSKTNTESPL